MRNDFYVYLHRKATTNEVFYVGKGSGSRAYDKKMRNRHWHFVAKKHGFIVEFVEVGLQEWAAFEIESDLIFLFGRKDLGDGELVNYTNGGDGSSGFVMSNETKNKISKATLGKKKSDETKRKMSDANRIRVFSPETKKKISESLSGRVMDESVKGKIRSACLKNTRRSGEHYKARKVLCVTTNVFYETAADAAKWLVSLGHSKAVHTNILHVCKGRHSHCYGYVWEYA